DHSNTSECLLHGHDHVAHAFLLVLHRVAGAPPVNPNRHQTGGEKNQCDNGEFPIHYEEDSNSTDNCDWLLKKIAADAGQSHLHGACIVGNTRHQKTRAHLVKEIHRMANHLVKKLPANIGDHFVAYPVHVVGVSVRAAAAHRHDRWNGEADDNDRIDLRASA